MNTRASGFTTMFLFFINYITVLVHKRLFWEKFWNLHWVENLPFLSPATLTTESSPKNNKARSFLTIIVSREAELSKVSSSTTMRRHKLKTTPPLPRGARPLRQQSVGEGWGDSVPFWDWAGYGGKEHPICTGKRAPQIQRMCSTMATNRSLDGHTHTSVMLKIKSRPIS